VNTQIRNFQHQALTRRVVVIVISDSMETALTSLYLLWLNGNKPLSIGYISEKLGMSYKSTEALLEQFENGGIVEKNIDSEYVLTFGPRFFTVSDLGHLLEEDFFTSKESKSNVVSIYQHKDISGLRNLKQILFKSFKNISLAELFESCSDNDKGKVFPFSFGTV